MAALDWSQCPAVKSIPGKVSGAWVLKGTRMPVSVIFENIEAGASIDDPAARILGDRFANGESLSWLSDVLRQHSQEWLCHKDLKEKGDKPNPPLRFERAGGAQDSALIQQRASSGKNGFA